MAMASILVKVESDDEETLLPHEGHQQTIDDTAVSAMASDRIASVDPNVSASVFVTPVKQEEINEEEIISNLRKEKHCLSQKVTRYQRKSNQYKQQLEDTKNENMEFRENVRMLEKRCEIFESEKSQLLREIDQLKHEKNTLLMKINNSSGSNSNSTSDMRESDEESSTSYSSSSSSSSDHSFSDKNPRIPRFITTTSTTTNSSLTKTKTNNNITHSIATGKRKQTSHNNSDVTSTTRTNSSSIRQNKKARQEIMTQRRSMNNSNNYLKPSSRKNNGIEGHKDQNRFVPFNIKSGKYKHFEKCNLFVLLDEQGWKFKHNVGSRVYYYFFPPGKTQYKDSLASDIKVREYLIQHDMMTKELKKAFDKYDREVEKEKNGDQIEELLQGDVPSNIKTGKYRHFEKCNLFVLLDEQGWRFKVFEYGIHKTFKFYPPGKTHYKDILRSDIIVREYLIQHDMMTQELKKAFDKYDREVQKEKNGVHNEELSQEEKSSTSSFSSSTSSSSSSQENENRFVPSNIKTGKYKHFEKCNLFVLLDEQGWRFKVFDYGTFKVFKFYPPGKTMYTDILTSDIKVRKYLIRHDMMTEELKKAFDKYDQEVQKEKNGVHNETDD